MTKAAYSPMRKAEKYVSQDDMLATLAKHAKPKVEVAIPKEPLTWLEPIKTGKRSGYVETACGLWRLSKDDLGTSIVYTSWKTGSPPTNLGCSDTRAQAEALVEGAR